MTADPPGVPPRISEHGPRSNVGLALGLLALGIAASAVLFLFNPTQYGFYPICLFRKLTGWSCPGCGSLRALHQLLHGNPIEALRLNALLVLALPAIAWVGFRTLYELIGGNARPLTIRPLGVWLGVATIVLFGILRNVRF